MTVHAFDAAGKPVDPDDPSALTAEVITDDGLREYVYLGQMPPVYADTDPIDDAIEHGSRVWDLEWDGAPVTTLAQLTEFLGGDRVSPDTLATRVTNVMLLPSWENAPETLRQEVFTYLAG